MSTDDIYVRKPVSFIDNYKVRIIKNLNGMISYKLVEFNDTSTFEVSELVFNDNYEFSEKFTKEYLIRDIIE